MVKNILLFVLFDILSTTGKITGLIFVGNRMYGVYPELAEWIRQAGVLEHNANSNLEYRYPLLQSPTIWKEMDCSLASLDDLACMKLSAIAGRGARRDFCDI